MHLLMSAMITHSLGLELVLSDTLAHRRRTADTTRHHGQQAVDIVCTRPLLVSENLSSVSPWFMVTLKLMRTYIDTLLGLWLLDQLAVGTHATL